MRLCIVLFSLLLAPLVMAETPLGINNELEGGLMMDSQASHRPMDMGLSRRRRWGARVGCLLNPKDAQEQLQLRCANGRHIHV